MVNVDAEVMLPAAVDQAFVAVTDLANADWLPGIRRVTHIEGPAIGLKAKYEVEAGLLGRHLDGTFTCQEWEPPQRAFYKFDDPFNVTVEITVKEIHGGCSLKVEVCYEVGSNIPFAAAVEKASIGPARREVARALEQFAARFGRK